MTPDQFEKFLKSNNEATKSAVELHVNGKIDNLTKLLEQHSVDDKEYQKKIDGNIQWAVRLIVGAVVLGAIGMIIK